MIIGNDYWYCGKNRKVKRFKKSVEDRFFDKVYKTRTCWEWTGSKNPEGYGNFLIGNRIQSSHRSSYQLFNGNIGNGQCVLHKCDNPSCVNPKHLFLGTKQDNANDAIAKGRTKLFQSNWGEKNPAARLTAKQVIAIRKEFKPKIVTRYMLADKYGVSWQTISDILYGGSWAKIK